MIGKHDRYCIRDEMGRIRESFKTKAERKRNLDYLEHNYPGYDFGIWDSLLQEIK